MSALPLHSPVIRLASQTVPESLRLLFRRAELAEPPVSIRDLSLDSDTAPGARKTLLSFVADRAELNLFILLSPGLERTESVRLEDPGPEAAAGPQDEPDDAPAAGHLRLSRVAATIERVAPEPDFPWWSPEPFGPGRRYAFSTPDIDFVEVIIEDLSGTVFVRAIE